MKFSASLQWFTNVQWSGKPHLVDCLVDTKQCKGEAGMFLILEEGELYARPFFHINAKACLADLKVLGKIERWDIPLRSVGPYTGPVFSQNLN